MTIVPDNNQARTHAWLNENGEIAFKKEKYKNGDTYTWRYAGGKPNGVEHLMWDHPNLLSALASGDTVYWCAGEKDAIAVAENTGCVATSVHEGEKNGKQGSKAAAIYDRKTPPFVESTSTVVLIGDCDNKGDLSTGQADLVHRYDALIRAGVAPERIKPVLPPQPHNDAYDAIQAGNKVDSEDFSTAKIGVLRERYIAPHAKPAKEPDQGADAAAKLDRFVDAMRKDGLLVASHEPGVSAEGQCPHPSHDDSKPSFGVSVGDNGGLVMECHGCAPDPSDKEERNEWLKMIVGSLGLRLADISPPTSANDESDIAGEVRRLRIREEALERFQEQKFAKQSAKPIPWADVDDVITKIERGFETTPTVGATVSEERGYCLFYRGRTHAVAGNPGEGKSFLAAYNCSVEIERGHNVIYVDFESDALNVHRRMMSFGIGWDSIRKHFRYLRVSKLEDLNVPRIAELVKSDDVTLVILDGVTVMSNLYGLDLFDAQAMSKLHMNVAMPLADAGAAVCEVDHLPKSVEGKPSFAYGSMAKKGILTGCLFVVTRDQPFGINREGSLDVMIQKDRDGYLEGLANEGRLGAFTMANVDGKNTPGWLQSRKSGDLRQNDKDAARDGILRVLSSSLALKIHTGGGSDGMFKKEIYAEVDRQLGPNRKISDAVFDKEVTKLKDEQKIVHLEDPDGDYKYEGRKAPVYRIAESPGYVLRAA